MLYVLDGSGFLFRAYYSLPDILDKNGNSAGAIFGFFRMLLKLLQQKPDHFVIVFDPGTKTKRQEEFKEYKQNRPEIDDKFKKQIPQIIDILKNSGFDVEIVPEYEADDVIASIVKNYDEKIVVVSSDKDLKQLISDKVDFLEPKKMEFIDKEKFVNEFGFEPQNLDLYLALIGDSSDNIPGIPGIGPKTAQKIVSQFPSYDLLINNLDKLSPKIADKIKENQDILKRNLDLIRLKNPLEISSQQIEEKSNVKNINWDKLKDILVNEYGFKSFDKLIDKVKKEIVTPNQISLF